MHSPASDTNKNTAEKSKLSASPALFVPVHQSADREHIALGKEGSAYHHLR